MTEPVFIHPLAAELAITGHAPTVWQYANLAEQWYRDTQKESEVGDGEGSTRREIVFAACFLESYIFEWVRGSWPHQLNECFPPTRRFKDDPLFRATLKEKWKLVPHELHRVGVLDMRASLELSPLGTLIQLRNGLIHARASRPSTSGQSEAEKPRPALGELSVLGHGWALAIAKTLVTQLHEQVRSEAPSYV